MTFIGLNPSMADAETDSPTIRKLISYAKREGMGGIHLVNLFAYRTSNPLMLKDVADPVGPSNYFWLSSVFQHNGAGIIVAMWGKRATADEINVVKKLSKQHNISIYAIGKNQDGSPKHPLYTHPEEPLVRWN